MLRITNESITEKLELINGDIIKTVILKNVETNSVGPGTFYFSMKDILKLEVCSDAKTQVLLKAYVNFKYLYILDEICHKKGISVINGFTK